MVPKVSILLPVRNEATHLPAALSSLFRQSLRDWELVAVDDGSTDATPEILADAERRDSRVQVFRQSARGLVKALNRGLEACRAPLVARMDGDDICHPRRLERQTECLEGAPELTLVTCCVRHIPRMKIRGGMLAYERWQNSLHIHQEIMRNFFVESPFVHPSVMFRHKAVLDAGGYREMGWSEDYDLWLRLAQRGARFARLPETLFFWRDRSQRLTRTADYCSLNAFRTCKAHFLSQGFLRNKQQVTLWGAGQEGKAWRKALAEAGIEVCRWIEIDPRKIGQIIHGAPVCAPDSLFAGQGSILITVGTRGARDQIRRRAETIGLAETIDYLCVT